MDSRVGLSERKLGKFQGFVVGSDSTATAEFNRRSNALGDDLDGGETLEQHLVRVSEALARIRQQHPTGSVLISHTGSQ